MSIPIGLHADIPSATYHAYRAASASGLKTIHAGTPAHLAREWATPRESTEAMDLGTALHHAVLEPEAPSPVVARPASYVIPKGTKCGKYDPQPGETVPWNPRTNYCRDWVAAQEAAGRIVLDERQAEAVGRAADAILHHHTAGDLLRRAAHRETTLVWQTVDAVPCKARLDAYWDGILVDLKTTRDASPRGFPREVWDRGYHLQLAWYSDALSLYGVEVREVYLVAVEMETGFACVHRAEPDLLDVGREAYLSALAQFTASWQSGEWPGYPDEAVPMDVPAWARRRDVR